MSAWRAVLSAGSPVLWTKMKSERPQICARRAILSALNAGVSAGRAVLSAQIACVSAWRAVLTEQRSPMRTASPAPPREAEMLCWLAFGEHEAAGLYFPPRNTRGALWKRRLPLPLGRLKRFAG